MINFNSKDKKSYKEFLAFDEAYEVNEYLLKFIDIFNKLDSSSLNDNIDIVRFHWKSIRNYLPLLLEFPSSFVEENDDDFSNSLEGSILIVMTYYMQQYTSYTEGLIGCDDRVNYFNSIIDRILNPVDNLLKVHEKLNIIPGDNIDLQIVRIFKIYRSTLENMISECNQEELEEIHKRIMMM